jgi:hypothetical protein
MPTPEPKAPYPDSGPRTPPTSEKQRPAPLALVCSAAQLKHQLRRVPTRTLTTTTMYSYRLWASVGLAALAAGAEVVTTPRQFEVDIVFPHNETYKPADTMPIVLAIQNASSRRQVHAAVEHCLDEPVWDLHEIRILGLCRSASRRSSDVQHPDIVGGGKNWLAGRDPRRAGGHPRVPGIGRTRPDWAASKRDEAGMPWVGDSREQARQPLYSVKVDQVAASSISSRVASSVSSSMSKYHPIPTTTAAVASSTSEAGVGPSRTVQTALAAACVLCGLAL